jgi:membrane-associated phospholipid phosphatase
LAIGSTVLYVLHTPLPIAIGAYLWLRHRPTFYDFLAALFILSIAAFATYLVFPAAPPWWAAATGHLAGPSGLPVIEHLKPAAFGALVTSVGFDGQVLFGLTFNDISPDPVAAFPSLHAAYPLLAYLFVRQVSRRSGVLMLAYTAAAWFAILYLGDHYLVDVIGGAVYALAAYAFLPIWRQLSPILSSGWSDSGSRAS